MTTNHNFAPDWVSAPGSTILDILEEKHLSEIEFAKLINCTHEYVIGLIKGTETITIEIARKLETVFGASADFWINRESQYRQDLARFESKSDENWIKELPIKDITTFGWLKPFKEASSEMEACLRFFNVSSVAVWRARYSNVHKMADFRTSPTFNSEQGALAAWLRQGEIVGDSIDCKPWNAKIFEEALPQIKALTRIKEPSEFIPKLIDICAACGVAVAIVRAPTGCRSSGATFFISSQKALLLLSFRYLSDDHFWFTFFHEAAHLLLHDKDRIFLEDEGAPQNAEEKGANDFAAAILIPMSLQSDFLKLGLNGFSVIRFAKRAGVSPGIIVGQLQHHRLITQRQLNNLKRRYNWATSKF